MKTGPSYRYKLVGKKSRRKISAMISSMARCKKLRFS